MRKSLKIVISILILAFIAFLILIFSGTQIYTDWLWFNNLGFARTFITMFFTNLWLRILVGLVFTGFIFLNLFFTRKHFLEYINIKKDANVESLFGEGTDSFISWLNKKRLNYIYLLGSIILGFLFSSISQELWKIVLKYFNQTAFGMTDPIFNRDISFYVFSLPFFNFLREMGMVLVILTLIVIAVIYTLASGISSFNEMKFKLPARAKTHLIVLATIFLFLKAYGYRLSMYELLFSPQGIVFGAGYTDINANLLGLKIMFIIAIVVGIILLVNIFKKSYKILLYALGFWLLTSLIFGNIYPGFVQRYQVEPNEIVKETEYINYNIDMTLKAYGLNDITTRTFEVEDELTAEVLEDNEETINNIRLWDGRPLRSTYNQLQGLRQYYTFVNMDVDRYWIDGEYRQVMLAGRELDQSRLSGQAQTWINQALKYTHGYGVTVSPVNRVTSEGLPEFYIKDIPPVSLTDLELENASIYYGEKTDNYVIANNKSEEFHYPMGSKNIYTNYDGTGGVQLDNFFKKVIYTIKHGNIKFLLSDDITTESRIMYNRNIKNRVRKVAPFLKFDNDPYLVIAEGRLFWIQDAYTTTDRFPYSQPIGNTGNYIRNSIKIIIDTYNGSMDFYVIDKSDPLAVTYQNIFPDLFKPGEEMPEVFRSHLRYPQDLFMIQSQLYSTYHMTDPTVFYNKEDLWTIPEETYSGGSVRVQPYYIIMKLPGNDKPEFIQMIPFSPVTKNNMIAWMASRSDGENYGELLVYTFPKDELVYGPMQIESRIEQDSSISQLLTLWSQRGSRVIRGNLLVIPINNSILYVEPVYLQAETSELPELKRVVVAYGDRIVMTERLDQALQQIFGLAAETAPEERAPEGVPEQVEIIQGTVKELTTQALELYQEAQESLQEGNWASYGELLEELEDVLVRINEISSNELNLEE